MNTPTVFDWFSTEFFQWRTITLKVQKTPLFRFKDKLHTAAVLLPQVNIYIQQNTTQSSQGQTCLRRGTLTMEGHAVDKDSYAHFSSDVYSSEHVV